MWLLLSSLLLIPPASLSTPSIPQITKSTVTPTAPATQAPKYFVTVNLGDKDTDAANYLVLPQNENGVLECTSEDFRHTDLYWFKNGEEVAAAAIRQVTLQIDGTNISSSGVYTCQSNTETAKQVTVFIEDAEMNDSTENIQDMEVDIKEEIELTVDLLVYPVTKLEYSLELSRVKEKAAVKVASYPSEDLTSQVRVVEESNSLKYEVRMAMPSNHGLYTFTVKYGDRQLRYEYFVSVKYAPIIASFKQIPSFVAINEYVTMTARVAGYPDPAITWWHQPCCPTTTPINITELLLREPAKFNNYHLINDDTILSLVDGTSMFNGTYWFEASNELGTVMSDKTDYRLRGYGITVNSGGAANVTSKALEENIGSLQLTCVVDKTVLSSLDTSPDIAWYHNGVEVEGTTRTNDNYEAKEILEIHTPGMGVAGTYNCIASTSTVTLWSFDVHVAVIKQPVIAVTPQVYRASVGTTVIFSCQVDNIDGEEWEILYKVKEKDQTFNQVTSTIPASEEDAMLYLPRQTKECMVRCLTSPSPHSQPVYKDGRVVFVKDPPVLLKVTTNRKRYTEGETLIIRCHVTSTLEQQNPRPVTWKHDGRVIGDSAAAERYFTTLSENEKTEVLVIETLAMNSTGDYTCVYDAGLEGRYEDSYDISVHPATPLNVIAWIIAVCFVCILVIIMGVVLYVIIRRSHTFSYSPSKHDAPKMEQTSL